MTIRDAAGGVRRLADDYLAERSAVDPEAAAALGRSDAVLLPDLTPEGFAARTEVDRTALARLDRLGSADTDPLGIALHERLTADIALYDSGFTTTLLAPLATEVHRLRQVFDDLPRDSDEDWERVAVHLELGARGYADYAATLTASLDAGHRIERRQVLLMADQCRSWIDPAGTDFYRSLIAGYSGSEVLARRLATAALRITVACNGFAAFLTDTLAARADDTDGAGPARYRITSTAFLGAEVDPAELYDYGWSELHRLTDAARQLGQKLTGETDLRAARAALDRRPGACVAVGDELVNWLQARLDRTADRLAGTHFDLPPDSRVQARMVTAGSGVMYYAPADPAGTRPGRVWWSVPPGTSTVPTWREVSTVHHEGLPGHHLQFAITQGIDDLHPWQRYLCHVHGYAEGWAHYSEQLAVDLGLLDDDAELLGVYGAQLWRAARIVIDIGLHLGYPIPARTSLTTETAWHPQMAAAFLTEVAGVDPATAGYEVDRYLGWPGQALAFKVGAKLWTLARTEAQQRLGPRFDRKEFHMTALRLGPMGLDPLRRALSGLGGVA